MTGEGIELAPARGAFATAGWVGLAFDLGGVVAALLFARRPGPMLWSARKISQFERDDGRRIFRATCRRRGDPALYAEPSV